jgi:hypothetical protein
LETYVDFLGSQTAGFRQFAKFLPVAVAFRSHWRRRPCDRSSPSSAGGTTGISDDAKRRFLRPDDRTISRDTISRDAISRDAISRDALASGSQPVTTASEQSAACLAHQSPDALITFDKRRSGRRTDAADDLFFQGESANGTKPTQSRSSRRVDDSGVFDTARGRCRPALATK